VKYNIISEVSKVSCQYRKH